MARRAAAAHRNITLAGGGAYWLTTSDIRAGQTANGSVAYPAPGSASTKIKISRVLPCQ